MVYGSLLLLITLSNAITGEITHPLTFTNTQVNIQNATTTHPITLTDCVVNISNLKSVAAIKLVRCTGTINKVDVSVHGWPLTIDGAENLTVTDSTFDAQMADADATIVNRDNPNFTKYGGTYSYIKFDNQGKTARQYGKPPEYLSHPEWKWFQTRSTRMNQDIYYGYSEKHLSKNITFQRCTFKNAKRAGLFINWTDNYKVIDCIGENTQDYNLGAEWTSNGLWKNNVCRQPVNYEGTNGGLSLMYHSLNITVENNKIDTHLRLFSNGAPIKNVTVRSNQVKDIEVTPGQFFEWSAAGWIEDVTFKDNQVKGWMLVSAGAVNNGPPELPLKRINVLSNKILGQNRAASIRTESIFDSRIEDNTVSKHIQDFNVDHHLTSTLNLHNNRDPKNQIVDIQRAK